MKKFLLALDLNLVIALCYIPLLTSCTPFSQREANELTKEIPENQKNFFQKTNKTNNFSNNFHIMVEKPDQENTEPINNLVDSLACDAIDITKADKGKIALYINNKLIEVDIKYHPGPNPDKINKCLIHSHRRVKLILIHDSGYVTVRLLSRSRTRDGYCGHDLVLKLPTHLLKKPVNKDSNFSIGETVLLRNSKFAKKGVEKHNDLYHLSNESEGCILIKESEFDVLCFSKNKKFVFVQKTSSESKPNCPRGSVHLLPKNLLKRKGWW